MLGIDANDLNNVFACRHFIMLKIGKIGDYLGCSMDFRSQRSMTAQNTLSLLQIRTRLFLGMTLGQPNSDFSLSPPPFDDYY